MRKFSSTAVPASCIVFGKRRKILLANHHHLSYAQPAMGGWSINQNKYLSQARVKRFREFMEGQSLTAMNRHVVGQ